MGKKHRRREYWLILAEEFENSVGLTQEAFALTKGVSVGTFRKWLYQIRQENSRNSAPLQFVEVTSTPILPPPPNSGARLFLGLRVMLEFENLPDVSYLAQLLGELE